MVRTFLGSLIGAIVALVVESGGDYVGSRLYPARVSDMWDRAQLAEAMASRPQAAIWISIASYFAAGLIGAWVGKKIAGTPAGAWIPAGLLAAMALVIGWSFPGPAWVMAATVAAPLIGGFLANHLVANRAVEVVEDEGATATTDDLED